MSVDNGRPGGKRSADDNSTNNVKKQNLSADCSEMVEKNIEETMVEEPPFDISGWREMWEKGQDNIWNFSKPHRYVTDTYEDLLAGQKKVKILFPFCGKDVHMKWFADRGHEVVGVEAVEIGAKQFFAQHYKHHEAKELSPIKGKVYISEDKQIRVYVCDFLDFNSDIESGFDAVWDRGGFGAACPEDQEKFAQVMLSEGMLKPDCRYYLETFDGDSKEGGTPEEVIAKCFQVGTRFNMKRLIHEEFVDESDYKEIHGHGLCEQPLALEKDCPCKDGEEKETKTEMNCQAELCKYGLDHNSPDYSDADWKDPVQGEGEETKGGVDSQEDSDQNWKMMVHVHVLTPCETK